MKKFEIKTQSKHRVLVEVYPNGRNQITIFKSYAKAWSDSNCRARSVLDWDMKNLPKKYRVKKKFLKKYFKNLTVGLRTFDAFADENILSDFIVRA